jgi:hypothetical protein
MTRKFFQEQRIQERKNLLSAIQDQDQNENKASERYFLYFDEHEMNMLDGIDFERNDADLI